MTRKRFTKLLMANGLQKREAETIALLYRYCGLSYSSAYRDYTIRKDVRRAFQNFWEMVRKAAEKFSEVAYAIEKIKQQLSRQKGE